VGEGLVVFGAVVVTLGVALVVLGGGVGLVQPTTKVLTVSSTINNIHKKACGLNMFYLRY
jgi:hypothetical protein